MEARKGGRGMGDTVTVSTIKNESLCLIHGRYFSPFKLLLCFGGGDKNIYRAFIKSTILIQQF